VEREEEVVHCSKRVWRVGAYVQCVINMCVFTGESKEEHTGSGSTTSNFPFHPPILDAFFTPNCSYSHSSAELVLHHLGSLNGFFLLR
jgi:hypothetical protein